MFHLRNFLLEKNEEIVTDKVTETDAGETADGEQTVQRSDEKAKDAESGASEECMVAKRNAELLFNKPTDEELMSIDDLLMQISDDMMLPSVTVAEVTKMKFGLSVEINEVQDKDWYYASLPQISATHKGKDPLEESDVVKGNPAREMIQLICGDVEFLVQLREQKYFAPGQPWTAMASKIIDLLSAAHRKYLEALLSQKKEHGLIWERPCSSSIFDDSIDGGGAVLAQFYSLAKSTCWVRPMVLIDEVCTPIQGNDYWRSSCRLSLFANKRQLLERAIEDSFVPHCYFIEPDQYWGASQSIIKMDIVVKSSVVDIFEKVPIVFCDVLQQEVELVSSDGSTVYRSPYPQSLSSSSDQLYFHLSSPMDEEVIATTDVGSTPAVAQLSLPPVVSESFYDLQASISRIIVNQSKESRRQDTEPLSKVLARTEKSSSDEESMSIDYLLAQIPNEMMLPSTIAAEPIRIKFGLGIEIKGVLEGDWYKANLQIDVADKGKAPLVEPDTVKGHPAREMFTLICTDIEFLVQIREHVIEEISSFFSSFSLRRLAVLGSMLDIVAKEEQILVWAETDSLQTVVARRMYIVAKYREMLLRMFLEARCQAPC
ncbi:hypothetical protein F511_17684 [Dorcoceras hygrometricum]|uniref:Uncharacterized protein n=1 Tax=Dorcoceras hygrometricum TaxID=472368 RepID=A0A2Z7C174_9LAMI|nr:hypothetical protein F511_17684 [Dorcoceras hygrometricum]